MSLMLCQSCGKHQFLSVHRKTLGAATDVLLKFMVNLELSGKILLKGSTDTAVNVMASLVIIVTLIQCYTL